MKRPLVISLALLVACAFLWWWSARNKFPTTPPTEPANPLASQPLSQTPVPGLATQPLPGDAILQRYASPGTTPRDDLAALSHAMQNFLLLAKHAAQGPLADNEDWAKVLLGRGRVREPFLSAKHPVFNVRGQLVDRWQTPLFIHALGAGRFELRSAGPDGKLWTDDDIHRNAEGTFRQGAPLNATNLWKP